MPIVPFSAFSFCGGSYQALSPVVEAQRAINLYPEKAMTQGAKTPVALIGRPGLTTYVTLPTGPVRALYAGNGRLFAVGGTHVYEVSPSAGTVLTDFGAIPSSSGAGPCQFAVCGTGATAHLYVMDSSVGQIFLVNSVGPAVTYVFDGFSLEYLDTFLFALKSGTDNQINQSNSNDGQTWDALDFVTITGTSDHKRRLIVVNGLMWIMGQQNIEVWYNAGTAGFTLSRMGNGTINIGIAGTSGSASSFTACRVMNTLLWCGSDERGFGKFWRADGLSPVRISTPGIEALMETYGTGYLYGARSFVEEYDGHSFYVTNFPTANSNAGATLVYDMTTGEWHERAYNNAGTPERARPDCFASIQDAANSTANFVGDYATGVIYKQDSSYTSDSGNSIRYTRTSPHLTNSNKWTKHQKLMLDGVWGSATPTLSWSDDGGVTFNTARDFQTIGTAAATGIKTLVSWALGRARDRVYKVVITTSADLVRLSNAWLSVSAGTEE